MKDSVYYKSDDVTLAKQGGKRYVVTDSFALVIGAGKDGKVHLDITAGGKDLSTKDIMKIAEALRQEALAAKKG